ncbi:aspartate dehydrogenase [Gordoniibacillus kamchatkensis]|uniref:L-aspartate dehydrogenase n=1 Tax=Gordoniibacillus kamchatkensis TaxID=1590651 RepID=A0ABR5ADD2_9BACL|nr:aspartate dehydrogenase [Paenibacillus sp. VKM B-2647]KIL39060.1 aspartate dehydrogenase [Paenibacillus sp. VKM B-2647]
MNIGLIGCGNIGKFLLESLNASAVIPGSRIAAVYDPRSDLSADSVQRFGVRQYREFDDFIRHDMDLVVEAANIQAVRQYAAAILKHGKNLVLISVGALADRHFYDSLNEVCRSTGKQIYLPSGAIGGLDVLKAAASMGQLDSVTITTRKPPKALTEETIDSETVLFDGSAGEAIALFPKNINVSIILALAGLGPDKTNVKIIADPNVEKNNHSIEATGSFGKLHLHVENDPMPSNPKTSYLAALSILSTLKNQSQAIHIG